MSTYLDMKKPCVEPLPSPPKAMPMKRMAMAARLWAASTLVIVFRPIVGGRPAVARRDRRPAASVW